MAVTGDVRWRQRFEHLERAFSRLSAACSQDSYSELELAGLIQMFEFTFELAWKTMKDLLTHEGFVVNSPPGGDTGWLVGWVDFRRRRNGWRPSKAGIGSSTLMTSRPPGRSSR